MIGAIDKQDLIELNKLVIQEAINIKKFATKKEIENLNYKDFYYQRTEYCIYGLLTGECRSIRASELINKCCKNVFAPENPNESIWRYKKLINTEEAAQNVFSAERLLYYASPIERWLFLVEEDLHKKLIQFIKGEIEELKLD